MRSQLLHEAGGLRSWAVVLATGDEAMASLQAFVDEQAIEAAQLTGIGAFERATLGYFDWQSKSYRRNEVPEQVEVASLIGDVAVAPDGKRMLHIHLVLGRRDGTQAARPGERPAADQPVRLSRRAGLMLRQAQHEAPCPDETFEPRPLPQTSS